MSEFTQFIPPEPLIKPPIPEKTFDKYWLSKMEIDAPLPGGQAKMNVKFKLYNSTTNEITDDGMIEIEIPDVFQKASTDIQFATAMEMVFRVLKVELDARLV